MIELMGSFEGNIDSAHQRKLGKYEEMAGLQTYFLLRLTCKVSLQTPTDLFNAGFLPSDKRKYTKKSRISMDMAFPLIDDKLTKPGGIVRGTLG